jgi:arylsulfatase A-like enzyme
MRWIAVALLFAACGQSGSDAPKPDTIAADAAAVTAVPGSIDAAPAAPAEPARVEHAVWNLGDNRLLAHRLVDGDLVVDAGTSGVARYHRFGLPTPRWTLAVELDGERASTSSALPALEVPLTEAQLGATRVLARVHVTEPRNLTLKINGRKAAAAGGPALVPGWQTIEVAVEPDRWQVGENLIALEIGKRSQLAVAWLRVTAKPAAATDDPRAAMTYDAAADAFSLAGGAGLAWYVVVPEGAHLVGDVGGDAACRIEVGARASDGTFAGGLLAGAGARVDLSSLAGRAVRLELVARDCARATLTGARVTIHGEVPAVPTAGPPPRYVVLWVMDAMRADRIRAFEPGARPETPAFDELARSGVVFRQFYVQGNESQTSHTSVWTGLYPAVHGVRQAGPHQKGRIDKKFTVIAQRVHDAGYKTTAVTGNGFVNEFGGYTRGFDEFRNMMQEKGIMNVYLPGQKVVDAALGRLDALRADPVYLFLGTVDTHGPYIARKPWIDRYDTEPYNGPFQTHGTAAELGLMRGRMGCHKVPPKRDIERLRAIYDSAVSYQDHQLGRFVDQLKAWGIYDQTMILITADHGEEMFEEDRCGHGASLRESLVRVPLLVHYPARFPSGVIVDEGAEGVDVMPTFLDAIGAPGVDAAQGTSLRPLAYGVGKGWVRPSYASQYEYAHTMRLGRYKARVGKSGIPIVIDLAEDPEEHKDLVRARPVERRLLTDHLSLFLALRTRWKKAEWGVISNLSKGAVEAIDVASTP